MTHGCTNYSMSVSNEQLADDLGDIVQELATNPVEEYQVGSRRVRRAHASLKQIVQAKILMDALASPKRGLSVTRRTDVR